MIILGLILLFAFAMENNSIASIIRLVFDRWDAIKNRVSVSIISHYQYCLPPMVTTVSSATHTSDR